MMRMFCARTWTNIVNAKSKLFSLVIDMIKIGIGYYTQMKSKSFESTCNTWRNPKIYVCQIHISRLSSQFEWKPYTRTHAWMCSVVQCAWGWFLSLVVLLSDLSRIILPLYLSNVHKDFPPLICAIHFWLLNHFHLYFFVSFFLLSLCRCPLLLCPLLFFFFALCRGREKEEIILIFSYGNHHICLP